MQDEPKRSSCNNHLVILWRESMQSISQLKAKFERLPVDENNWELYENLLALDQSVFKPLMEEILAGRMDIEDTRPIFAKYFPRMAETFRDRVNKKRWLINTTEEFRENLSRRYTEPEKAIREITLRDPAYEDIKQEMIAAYEAETGETLTESERKALIIAMSETEKIDIDLYGDKTKQIRLSDLMSGASKGINHG